MRADLTAGDARRPSVIVRAGAPRWLELALWSLAGQTHREFELVVADDGAEPATAEVTARFARAASLDVAHVRPDDGIVGTSEILNRAVLASGGDYLVFLDGRCVARADLVATHVRLARRGTYVAGSAVAPGLAAAERMTVDDVVTGRAFDSRWLAPRTLHERAAARRLARGPATGAARDLVSRTPARFQATNVATWRGLLVAANGFDLDVTTGGEDRSLGVRLELMGVRGLVARARAVALRLETVARPREPDAASRETRALLTRIRSRREVRAARGLAELRAQHPPAAPAAVLPPQLSALP